MTLSLELGSARGLLLPLLMVLSSNGNTGVNNNDQLLVIRQRDTDTTWLCPAWVSQIMDDTGRAYTV